MNFTYRHLGQAHRLLEGQTKVIGQTIYTSDMQRPDMLYAHLILSPYAHARIRSINKQESEAVAGVVAVLTQADLPSPSVWMTSRANAMLAKDMVYFVGQPVAVVVAETPAAALDGAEQVHIDYDPLPVVSDMAAAILADTPEIRLQPEASTAKNVHLTHQFQRGDIQLGFQEADLVIEHTYIIPRVHQGYLEPLAAIAEPNAHGDGLTLYTSTQGHFMIQGLVAQILNLKKDKVQVVPMAVGGGFGGKHGVIEPLLGAIALSIQRPVQLVLPRSQDFLTTQASPAFRIWLKTGVKNDGELTVLHANVELDCGIFGMEGGYMAGLMATVLGGYYQFPHIQIDYVEICTHKPQVGAYRAPGGPHATLAIESNMDEMAQVLGLDSLEFRFQNASETGDLRANGQPWPDMGLKRCLAALRDHPFWQNRDGEKNQAGRTGYGLAIGGWLNVVGSAGASCHINREGIIEIRIGAVDISGINSSFVLIAAEAFDVTSDQIRLVQRDTASDPHAPSSSGSQITYSVAGAIDQAVQEAKTRLLELASGYFEAAIDDLEIRNGFVQVRGVPKRRLPLGDVVQLAGGDDLVNGEGFSALSEPSASFIVQVIKVCVDPETGQVTPTACLAIQDVGFALNPLIVEGQIHGGIGQGIGIGLHEALRYDDEGQAISASFLDYDLPKASDIPAIEALLLENSSPHGPFGARGVGEPPILTSPAAIANAIKQATNIRLTELPIHSEKVWQALQQDVQD
ncbi:MAG: xanthine dehydrogenase family protein molybdopterin-binding subunit [Chloroflexota bacterium]